MCSEVVVDVPSADLRILRRAEVDPKTGFKHAHIFSLMEEGKSPRPMRFGPRDAGWNSVEIDRRIADRRKERT